MKVEKKLQQNLSWKVYSQYYIHLLLFHITSNRPIKRGITLVQELNLTTESWIYFSFVLQINFTTSRRWIKLGDVLKAEDISISTYINPSTFKKQEKINNLFGQTYPSNEDELKLFLLQKYGPWKLCNVCKLCREYKAIGLKKQKHMSMLQKLKTIAVNKVTNRWRNHNNKTTKISELNKIIELYEL